MKLRLAGILGLSVRSHGRRGWTSGQQKRLVISRLDISI